MVLTSHFFKRSRLLSSSSEILCHTYILNLIFSIIDIIHFNNKCNLPFCPLVTVNLLLCSNCNLPKKLLKNSMIFSTLDTKSHRSNTGTGANLKYILH